MQHNRRTFLQQSLVLGSAMGLAPVAHFFLPAPATRLAADPIDPTVVQEYVRVAHSDLDRLKAIQEEHPLIVYATWDWGDGDFETALGAAGHMGRRDVAEYLLDKGARPDLFVLTMLGETAIVKSILERYPQLLHAYGPHGFTLLHHARKGGEQAQNLYDFLVERGLTEPFVNIFNKK